jgi:hypothetical protein
MTTLSHQKSQLRPLTKIHSKTKEVYTRHPAISAEIEAVLQWPLHDAFILRKLHHRLIDETTVPARLVLWIGDATDTMPGLIWSYLAHEPLAMHADFFAPDGKKIGGKMSFPAAVAESQLGDADKQFWLASTGS